MLVVWKKCCLLLVVVIGLVACVEDQQMAEGGIGGTGISTGPISGFGSIIVNGVHFDVSQAQIWMDGQLASEQDLQPGMVVTVYGDIDEETQAGLATDVVFSASLSGAVESIDVDGRWLIVSGQRVYLDELTVLDGLTQSEIMIGRTVMISGVNDAAGNWLAAYIASEGAAQQTTGEPVADGSAVNEPSPPSVDNDETVPQSTPFEPEITTADAGWLSLRGLITEVEDNHFTLQGKEIVINNNSTYENGDVTDIAINSNVAVIAVVNDSGEVLAKIISFRPVEVVRIDAQVESLVETSVTLAGISVAVNSSTLMLDSSVAAVRVFSLKNLAVGDELVVYGFQITEGVVLTRLERFDSIAKQRISGPVGNISQPVFEVLGVTVDVSIMMGADDLFAAMNSGDWITVTGSLNGAVLVADEVMVAR